MAATLHSAGEPSMDRHGGPHPMTDVAVAILHVEAPRDAGPMTIAVAGRVVPGPRATDGTVRLPMRVEVKRGEEVLYSNVADYEVAVNKAGGAAQFIYSDPNVTFPTPTAADLQAYIGYEPGPEKKKKADDEL